MAFIAMIVAMIVNSLRTVIIMIVPTLIAILDMSIVLGLYVAFILQKVIFFRLLALEIFSALVIILYFLGLLNHLMSLKKSKLAKIFPFI